MKQQIKWIALVLLVCSPVWLLGADAKMSAGKKGTQSIQLQKEMVVSAVDESPEEAIAQRAKGFMLKGELKTMTANTGKIVGHDFSNWSNPEGLYKGFQYMAAVGMMVGVNGARPNDSDSLKARYPWSLRPHPSLPDSFSWWGPTVSESHFDRTNNVTRPDWMPVQNHNGRLHSGLAISSEIEEYLAYAAANDLTPLMATSDKPVSWPTGYYNELGDWMYGPVVPYADLSDDEKTLVDSLRAQYDEENEVWHFWPGPWAKDPNPNSSTFNQDVPGTFFSDVDVHMAFDDRWAIRDVDELQGYTMGVEVKCSGLSYGRSFAEDIIFFPVQIINKSNQVGTIRKNRNYVEYTNNGAGWDYKDMYVGFYFDVDAYNKQADGNTSGRTNEDDMMAYNRDLDFAYIWDLDDESGNLTGMAYSSLKFLDSPPANQDVDLDGDGATDVNQGEKLGLTDWHWFDWYARPGVRAVETSLGPFVGDGTTPVAPNKEETMFRVMSGDTTGLSESQKDWYFWHSHPDATSSLHYNSLDNLFADYPDGLDCVLIASAGPFDLAVGDTVNSSFAMIMGDSPIDLEQNAEIAQLMYDNYYQGPDPPKAPNVHAVVSPYTTATGEIRNKVTLYWDRRSETYRDVMTGYQDFEGYRVYKSTDGGNTWGDPEKDIVRDELGIARAWLPIAECDKIDGIGGRDQYAPWLHLGNDERDFNEGVDGLFHSFTDLDIEDGVAQSYAVTAFDYGIKSDDVLLNPLSFQFDLESLENFKGNSNSEPQFVKVIPQARASNFVDAKIDTNSDGTVKRIAGTGLAKIQVEVADPYLVTGHTYQIMFRDSLITTTVPALDSMATDTLYGRLDTLIVYDYFADSTKVSEYQKLVYNVWDVDESKWALVDNNGDAKFSDKIFDIDGTKAGVGTTIDSLNNELINGTEYAPIFDGVRLNITNVAKRSYFRRAFWSGESDWEIDFTKWATVVPKDYLLIFNSSTPDSAYQLAQNRILRVPIPFKAYEVVNGDAELRPVDAVWMDLDEEPYGEFSRGDVLGFIEDATFFETPAGTIPQGSKTWKMELTWYDEDTWVVFPEETLITQVEDTETGLVLYDTTIVPADSVYRYESVKWADGDTLRITTWKPLTVNDIFEFGSASYQIDPNQDDMLENIRVVPNPYIVSAYWETDANGLKIQFINLPKTCTIDIFNLAGERIKTLDHWSPNSQPGTGTEDWNLWTVNRQEVAFGLYIYAIRTPDGQKKIGKFAIIR